MPEAEWHYNAVRLLRALLEHWIGRTGKDAKVFCNLAIRVRRDKPGVGFDPDLALVTPVPPGADRLSSLRLWEPGHTVPALVIEVVSPGHPYKDYVETPDQCAALGVRELAVFDPMLAGPKALGRPTLLQLWRRTEEGAFTRVGAGDGPLASEVLGACLVPSAETCTLRIADEATLQPWPTAEEAERAEKEAQRAEKEVQRAEKERALTRVAELEAELRRRA